MHDNKLLKFEVGSNKQPTGVDGGIFWLLSLITTVCVCVSDSYKVKTTKKYERDKILREKRANHEV